MWPFFAAKRQCSELFSPKVAINEHTIKESRSFHSHAPLLPQLLQDDQPLIFVSGSQSNCFHLKKKTKIAYTFTMNHPPPPESFHKSTEWRGRRLGWQREETYRSYSLIEGNVDTEWQVTLLEKALLPQVLEQVCSSIGSTPQL